MKILKKYIFYILLITYMVFIPSLQFAQEVQTMKLYYDGKVYNYKSSPITLKVNGEKINTQMPPVILQNRTLVPAREVFEPMLAIVNWLPQNRQVYIALNDTLIILQVDNNTAYVNGSPVQMDVPAKIINDKLMIPARFVADTLGLKVGWQEKERIVSISGIEIIKQENNNIQTNTNSSQNEKVILENKNFSASKNEFTKIEKQSYEDVDILNVEPVKTGEVITQFKVSASGKISDVQQSLEDNKIVLDIENSEMKTKSSSINVATNEYVKLIRLGQKNVSPNITRVVFDLNKTCNYDVRLSDDRTNIIVEFKRNDIYKVEVGQNEKGDYLNIKGNYTPYTDIFRLSNPERLVFDIPYSQNVIGSNEKSTNMKFVSKVRINQFTENTTRIVVDLKSKPTYQIKIMNDNSITIQLAGSTTTQTTNVKSNKIVVIDPGHGGKDPGAVANGLKEKDLNLDISMRLKALLEQDSSIQVYYTRTSDTYPTLQERIGLANALKADLFISIHNNSNPSSQVTNGTETLYSKTNADLAQIMENSVANTAGTKNRGIIRRDGLYVLGHAEVPAVLVEVGYLTNSNDVSKLSSADFKQNVAEGLYKGIEEVLK